MILTTDDLCLENLKHFKYWDAAKQWNPDLEVIAFTIANYRNEQDVSESQEFKDWFEDHKDWVTIGVHGYDHLFPPEQERDDAEELVKRSIDILEPFLPERFLYRPPGFQRTIHTEPALKRLSVAGIAYQTRIRWFDTGQIEEGIFNSHCTENKYSNPIGKIWQKFISGYPRVQGNWPRD